MQTITVLRFIVRRVCALCLEVGVARSSEDNVTDVFVQENALSDIFDHFPVHFCLPVYKTKLQERKMPHRKYRHTNTCTFQKDIHKSILHLIYVPDIPLGEVVVDQYNATLTELLDKHAPAQ